MKRLCRSVDTVSHQCMVTQMALELHSHNQRCFTPQLSTFIWSCEITKQAQKLLEPYKNVIPPSFACPLFICREVVPKLCCVVMTCTLNEVQLALIRVKCFTSSGRLEISPRAMVVLVHEKKGAQLFDSGSALQHPITPQKRGENQMSESFIAGQRKGQASLFLGPPLPQ